jgi:hypothetical protein
MGETEIFWSDYMRYRLRLRNFNLVKVEHIVRHASERYRDTTTDRLVAVGRHDDRLIMIPYESNGKMLTPVTVHVTSRQQINFRVKSGRFENE